MNINWRDDYGTGYEEVDRQHKLIFQKVNELFAACKAGASSDQAIEMNNFLVDYCKTHFLFEESLMSTSFFPMQAEHIKAHNVFRKFINDFDAGMQAEGVDVGKVVTLNRELISWLVEHIMKMDVEMGKYLSGARI